MFFLVCLRRVWQVRTSLGRTEVIVIAPHAGFGHSVTGPDVARRLFRDRHPAFLLFSDSRFHNSRIDEIWPDVLVLSIPLAFDLSLGLRLPCVESAKRISRAFTLWLLRQVTLQNCEYLEISEMYGRLPLPESVKAKAAETQNPSLIWPIGYFRLQERASAPHVRLPLAERRRVETRLSKQESDGRSVRKCNLYLRLKQDGDLESKRRCGSPITEYLPAIRLLNDSGYRVLLTGERQLPDSVFEDFGGMLIDSAHADVEKELFDLYAATESSIFIGESGGGVWLPGLNEIPRLLINAFPFFFALPHSWVYYKTVLDPDGHLIPYHELFLKHAQDYELTGWTVLNNTSEQILEAVSSFLNDLTNPNTADSSATVIEELPDSLWVKYGSARISKAWLKLYNREKVFADS